MNIMTKNIPLDYQGGTQVLDRINEYLNDNRRKTISEIYGIKASTIATWTQRDQTPFELAIRMHLLEGVSLQWLLFGKGEMLEKGNSFETINSSELFHIDQNGNLIQEGSFYLDSNYLKTQLIMTEQESLLITSDSNIVVINKSLNTVTHGTYLIKIENAYSLTALTRLPQGKLLANLYGREIEINESDIQIEGKVVAKLTKS